jgi:hypothetical protein
MGKRSTAPPSPNLSCGLLHARCPKAHYTKRPESVWARCYESFLVRQEQSGHETVWWTSSSFSCSQSRREVQVSGQRHAPAVLAPTWKVHRKALLGRKNIALLADHQLRSWSMQFQSLQRPVHTVMAGSHWDVSTVMSPMLGKRGDMLPVPHTC